MTPTIIELTRPYRPQVGVGPIDRVDTGIFIRRYFTACRSCTFCNDQCCSYGAEIDEPNVDRLLQHAEAIEARIGVGHEDWFDGEPREDADFDGGAFRRTSVRDGGCVFLVPGAGCAIHAHAAERGIDYHELKPMVCSLFPVTWDLGLLRPAYEVQEESLVCLNVGPTLYVGVRDEIGHYFSGALLAELDAIEATLANPA